MKPSSSSHRSLSPTGHPVPSLQPNKEVAEMKQTFSSSHQSLSPTGHPVASLQPNKEVAEMEQTFSSSHQSLPPAAHPEPFFLLEGELVDMEQQTWLLDFMKAEEKEVKEEEAEHPEPFLLPEGELVEMEQPDWLLALIKGEEEQVKEEEAEHGRPPPSESNEASGWRPLPTLPNEFLERIVALRGDDVKMVMEKRLTNTDLSRSGGRLNIPMGKIRVEFLSKEEEEILETKKSDGKSCEEMIVPLVEPNLNESSISLKKWQIGKTGSYVLSSRWLEVVKRNGLKVRNRIQLWSFRVNGSLRLALIKLRE